MLAALRNGDPRTMGPYRLTARLGAGGMGWVYLGRSKGGRPVAVKVVRDELVNDPGFRRRFALEVEAARRVGGHYTAQMVDADTGGPPPWFATAYIAGPSLQWAVDEHGPLPAGSVAALGAGLAEGLAAVHAKDLVHRDLKPGNIILASDGPRLIDFGIARAMDSTSYTQAQGLVGTPAFMSPEQARAEEVAPSSDVFALGGVLAYAATGTGPFGSGAPHAVGYRIVHEAPDLAGLPGSLVGLVTSCLDKRPERRPSTDEVLDALASSGEAEQVWADGQWVPEAVTEVITLEQTRALTLVETDPPKAPSKTGGQGKQGKPPQQKAESNRKEGEEKPKQQKKPSSPKPSKKADGSTASSTRTPGTPGSSEPGDDPPRAKPSGGGWWTVLGAAVLAVLLYVNHSGFSGFVNRFINNGLDDVEAGDCIDPDGNAPVTVEVPCISATASYSVAAVRSKVEEPSLVEEPPSFTGLPFVDEPPDPVCADVPGYTEATWASIPIDDTVACLKPNP